MGFLCRLITTVYIEPLNGEQRSRSDCAKAQSDLGLRCPHERYGSFPNVTRHIYKGDGADMLYSNFHNASCFYDRFFMPL